MKKHYPVLHFVFFLIVTLLQLAILTSQLPVKSVSFEALIATFSAELLEVTKKKKKT